MKSMIELTIIIVSYNTKEIVRKCITTIYATVFNVNYEIIVVDNASRDGSSEMIENEFKEVQLIKNNVNEGFAKANNQAIQYANGLYLLLLNSDAFVHGKSIETLVAFMKRKEMIAAVGPKILNIDNTLQSKGYIFESVGAALLDLVRIRRIFSEKMLNRLFPSYYWDENETRQVDWISGCCMLIHKKSLEVIGPLSEVFFMYCEDLEWCYRARKKGYQIWYVHEAEVYHLNCSSPLSNRVALVITNINMYYKITGGLALRAVILLLYILSNCIKLANSYFFSSKRNERDETKKDINDEIDFLKLLVSNYYKK